MEPSSRCKEWRPYSHSHPHPPHHHFHHYHHHHHHLCHHHHHHHHLPLCHHHHLNHHHFNSPNFAPLPPQNPAPVAAAPLQNNLKLDATFFNEAHNSTTQMFPEEEHEVLEEEEVEEDDEPIFVLTDEWREFFAKSEAKRKLEKKQAKKK